MRKVTTGLLAAVVLMSASVAYGQQHTKDSLDTVKANLKAKKAVLIDVRERDEWKAGHLKAAQLVPLSELKRGKGTDRLDKKKIIYCHCRSGGRVLVAARLLKKGGYDVRPLKSGYTALLKAGFEKAKE